MNYFSKRKNIQFLKMKVILVWYGTYENKVFILVPYIH